MSDSYELFCLQKISEAPSVQTSSEKIDTVSCACAEYLLEEGYDQMLGNMPRVQRNESQ